MACFFVPAAEAVVTTVVTKAVKARETEPETVSVSLDGATTEEAEKIPFSRKLGWLNKLLWGGSALLAFEHVWHGEVVPWFPFLTAAADPADMAEMVHEMSTVGVTMAVLVTAVWGGMVAVTSLIENRALKELPGAKKGRAAR
ncbi:MAG: hypothetical protein NC302_04010 [Bacteroidales bacterium]|nr:hypothetical protein [Bacteroidales bacterium]MCM1414824.1 hypothetical protein [bacterium]MCM1422455.1 hypothetical protein [bacterium]